VIGGPAADNFIVTVTDGYGGRVDQQVSVPITPANATPRTSFAVTAVAATGQVDGAVSATDADNDSLSYTTSSTPTNGTVTVDAVTGGFTYTPTDTARHAAAGAGATTDAFTVTVTDVTGAFTYTPTGEARHAAAGGGEMKTQVTARTNTSNWDYMRVSYTTGDGQVSNTVNRTTGSSVSGVLTRNSTTNVTIGLPSTTAFTLTVKYLSRSSATTYGFNAVQ
jgi:hypothetical protein